MSAVPVSAQPPPLVITTKLAAAIYGGVANNKYKYSIQYCPCGEMSFLDILLQQIAESYLLAHASLSK